jgi:hypothetical protein
MILRLFSAFSLALGIVLGVARAALETRRLSPVALSPIGGMVDLAPAPARSAMVILSSDLEAVSSGRMAGPIFVGAEWLALWHLRA